MSIYSDYKDKLEELIENKRSDEEIRKYVLRILEMNPQYAVSLSKATFSMLKDTDVKFAINVIVPYLERIDDVKYLNIVQKRMQSFLKTNDDENIEKELKRLTKRLLVLSALTDFETNVNSIGIQKALEALDVFNQKYYYLRRTILKKVHKKIRDTYPEEAKNIAKILVYDFNDEVYKKFI